MAEAGRVTNREVLEEVYKPRPPWAHKGHAGKLLVVGGSESLTGSPVFNALAAYRAGCDMVRVAAPRRAADAAANFSPNIITTPLEGKEFARKHVPAVLKLAESANALVVGSGLGRATETYAAVQALVKALEKPFVLDADGLRALAGEKARLLRGKRAVLTPHATEFYEMTGRRLASGTADRADGARELSIETGCVVLLKGHVDAIADGRRIALNHTGSAYMTKGGCGDTLAGICGAYLARGVEPFTAAKAAAFVNGRAGELAAQEKGEGMLATDLIEAIPRAIKG